MYMVYVYNMLCVTINVGGARLAYARGVPMTQNVTILQVVVCKIHTILEDKMSVTIIVSPGRMPGHAVCIVTQVFDIIEL